MIVATMIYQVWELKCGVLRSTRARRCGLCFCVRGSCCVPAKLAPKESVLVTHADPRDDT